MRKKSDKKQNKTEDSSEPKAKKLVDDDRCFACGAENKDGLQLKFETCAADRSASTSYSIPGKFSGWADITHGGIIATLLDEAMAYAAFSTGKVCVTGEMTVRYKKPVPTETLLHISGEINEQKHRILYASAEITMGNRTLASCKGKLIEMKTV